jgi:hypothetical protein
MINIITYIYDMIEILANIHCVNINTKKYITICNIFVILCIFGQAQPAERGFLQLKMDEYVCFHTNQGYPEYLIDFQLQ